MSVNKITIDVLTAVHAIQTKKSFGVAPTSEVVASLIVWFSESYIRVVMTNLKADGLLENPMHGGWRLTKAGKQLLEKSKKGE